MFGRFLDRVWTPCRELFQATDPLFRREAIAAFPRLDLGHCNTKRCRQLTGRATQTCSEILDFFGKHSAGEDSTQLDCPGIRYLVMRFIDQGFVAFVGLVATCSSACSEDAYESPKQPPSWSLALEPPSALDRASPVVAFIVKGLRETTHLATDLVLVEGDPSAISVDRYRGGHTTETLAERIVPTLMHAGSDELVVRSRNVLAIGQRYTLVAREGVIGKVMIAPERDRSYLMRIWPPIESTTATMQAIYCGSDAPASSSEVRLFPGDLVARIEPGIDPEGLAKGACVRLLPQSSNSDVVQPPVQVGDYSLQPSPFHSGLEQSEVQFPTCSGAEIRFAAGCLRVLSGAAIVRGPAAPTFWAVAGAQGWRAEYLDSGAEFAIPVQHERVGFGLKATAFDLAGRSSLSSVQLTAGPPSARVIINEVMANPLGPEPQQEWIELLNDGTASAEMVEWKLRDEGGAVEIPPLSIAPGAFVLLVRSDYVEGLAGEHAPAVGTTLIRLPQLGKAGLLNSGESLTLLDQSGQIVSSFPARASTRQGVSIARRNALTLDSDPSGFAAHAHPGATPGMPNSLD
jgi:hypothetical protein